MFLFYQNKTCTRCTKEKPLEDFQKSRARKDGYSSMCKSCLNERDRIKYAINPKKRISNQSWRNNNPEKVRASKKADAIKHADRKRESDKRWRLSNKERKSENGKSWYQANIDKVRSRARDWAKNNPIKRMLHNQTRRALKKNNGGKITAEEWQTLKKRYNHTCLCCGRKEPEIKLTIDHVLPLKLGGTNTISNAQPLCVSCNSSKKTKQIDYR